MNRIVIILMLFGVTIAVANPPAWQTKLRDDLNIFTGIPFGDVGTFHFSIPAEAAKILKNLPA